MIHENSPLTEMNPNRKAKRSINLCSGSLAPAPFVHVNHTQSVNDV